MNVYIVETARRLAERGVAVEIFTRATSSEQPPTVELAPGVLVRHVTAGPFEGLAKDDLPAQLCAFTAGVLRAEAHHEPGWYDLVHSHYWLSGQVGWLVRDRWGVPLVHSAHTLAKVKNLLLAEGDVPEPRARVIGEEQVVAEADRLIASTDEEAAQLVDLYGADPALVRTIAPGRRSRHVRPGRRAPRPGASSACVRTSPTLLFVGRIQPLKAPDVVLRAAAAMRADVPDLQVVVVGGAERVRARDAGLADRAGAASSTSTASCASSRRPAARPSRRYYRAADVTVVPSYTESFGLVALESQACGTPVVAAAVGGLTTAVADGRQRAARRRARPRAVGQGARRTCCARRPNCDALAAGARRHAERFSWQRTTDGLLAAYTRSDGAAMSEPPRDRVIEAALAELDLDSSGSATTGSSSRCPARSGSRPRAGSRSARTRSRCRRSSCASRTRTASSVYEFLLQRNVRMYGVSWAVDSMGDVYLVGRLPLAPVTPTNSTGCSAPCSSTPTGRSTPCSNWASARPSGASGRGG